MPSSGWTKCPVVGRVGAVYFMLPTFGRKCPSRGRAVKTDSIVPSPAGNGKSLTAPSPTRKSACHSHKEKGKHRLVGSIFNFHMGKAQPADRTLVGGVRLLCRLLPFNRRISIINILYRYCLHCLWRHNLIRFSPNDTLLVVQFPIHLICYHAASFFSSHPVPKIPRHNI